MISLPDTHGRIAHVYAGNNTGMEAKMGTKLEMEMSLFICMTGLIVAM